MTTEKESLELYKYLLSQCKASLSLNNEDNWKSAVALALLGRSGQSRFVSCGLLLLFIAACIALLTVDVSRLVRYILLFFVSVLPLIFYLLSIYRIIVDQGRSGWYKLLSTVPNRIYRQEEIIRGVCKYSVDSLVQLTKHLKYEVESRKSYLQLILGGSINLGAFPALFVAYALFTEALTNNVPEGIRLSFATIVIGLYVAAVSLSLEISRLESMIYCLECATERNSKERANN